MRPDRTFYLITIRFTIRRIIDSSTLRIFDHENWPNISRKTLAKLVKRETLRLSMNGRKNVWFPIFNFSARPRASCTAPCWCGPSTGSGPASTRASRRPSPSSSRRSSLSTWGINFFSIHCHRADICLSRVREFLSYVVPSNTLSSEEFKARCIDVMTGSVRRTDEVSSVKIEKVESKTSRLPPPAVAPAPR